MKDYVESFIEFYVGFEERIDIVGEGGVRG